MPTEPKLFKSGIFFHFACRKEYTDGEFIRAMFNVIVAWYLNRDTYESRSSNRSRSRHCRFNLEELVTYLAFLSDPSACPQLNG